MYCEVKDVSRFSAFGCGAWVHLNSERREKGKHTPRVLEALYLGFEPNTSSWCFFIPERQTLWSTNQAKSDEHSFPFRQGSMVDKFQHLENSCDILYQTPSQVKWEPYNKLHISNYKKVYYDVVSDVMVLQVNTRENTFVRVSQKQFNTNLLNLLTKAATEQRAHLSSAGHSTLKGLDPDIDPDRAPKNFKDAMSLKNRQEWAEALNKEYRGFKDHNAFPVVKPPRGVRILGTLTL
jgi:hypothetical protein